MIHIAKAKGGYMVIITGKKREVLATSEILKTKQIAFRNVWAQRYWFMPEPIYTIVQDDTGKDPICYMVQVVGKKLIRTVIKTETAQDLFTVKIKKYI
jgi:hypothetical protein